MIEVIAHALFQNRRGEGAERLAMLDAAVQDVFHLRPPRIGHDASVAQGARSELQPSLKPSYNLAVGDPRRRLACDLFIAQFHDPVSGIRNFFTVQSLTDLLVRKLRSPISVVHFERPGAAQDLMVDVECGPDGQACVARGGRDIDFLERRPVEDLAVGHAIERHAAGHTQFLHAVETV